MFYLGSFHFELLYIDLCSLFTTNLRASIFIPIFRHPNTKQVPWQWNVQWHDGLFCQLGHQKTNRISRKKHNFVTWQFGSATCNYFYAKGFNGWVELSWKMQFDEWMQMVFKSYWIKKQIEPFCNQDSSYCLMSLQYHNIVTYWTIKRQVGKSEKITNCVVNHAQGGVLQRPPLLTCNNRMLHDPNLPFSMNNNINKDSHKQNEEDKLGNIRAKNIMYTINNRLMSASG